MSGIHDGKILQDSEFELWSLVDGVAVRTKYRGAWSLVDNGYHKWACMQAPTKLPLTAKETRLSEWIESFRKDSECVFGILKGRFRVLKTGIRLEGAQAADRIWLTCCALHNFLLEADGLSEPWEGAIGQNEIAECRAHAPFAMSRLTDDQIRRFGSREEENEAVLLNRRDGVFRSMRRVHYAKRCMPSKLC